MSDMPRFVILHHDWPFSHWDLMLEQDGRLLTWRLLAEPTLHQPLPGEKSADHRLAYLDYEGPVSNGRGIVKRFATGELSKLEQSAEGIRADVRGSWFTGRITITDAAFKRNEEERVTINFLPAV